MPLTRAHHPNHTPGRVSGIEHQAQPRLRQSMNPVFQRARFLSAASGLDHAPPDQGAEVAFAGRSNAGKSSALNALCHQKRLARTSKTPGRTQQLVFFRLEDDDHRLVDLPGYGFAKVSVAIKTGWQQLMANYLAERQSLKGLVVLTDIRHPLTDIDRQMLAWGQTAELPLLILLTKADKLKRGAVERSLQQARGALSDLPGGSKLIAFSATAPRGVDIAQRWILDRLRLPTQPLPHKGLDMLGLDGLTERRAAGAQDGHSAPQRSDIPSRLSKNDPID